MIQCIAHHSYLLKYVAIEIKSESNWKKFDSIYYIHIGRSKIDNSLHQSHHIAQRLFCASEKGPF